MLVSLLFLACKDPAPAPLDLAEELGPNQVRAGKVRDEAALFGGISAEGQCGDFKIYNDRVRFILQGDRPGDYYITGGGAIVDADHVRPEAQPGRDVVDEWVPMIGIGRVQSAETIKVMNNGSGGKRAHIRVSGPETGLSLLEGALGVANLIPDLGLWIRTDYILEPGTPLMEVTTRLTDADEDVELALGDLLIASLDAANPWSPGSGLESMNDAEFPWTGFAGKHNEVALGVFSAPGETLRSDAAATVLKGLTRASLGQGPLLTVEKDAPVSWTRYFGVGRDFCELTDAWLALAGTETRTVDGVVEAPDGPVAGARVNVLVDGAPFTLCFTDAVGGFSAQVPEDAEVTFLAEGRGPGVFVDLPDGHGPYTPYAARPVRDYALATLATGAPNIDLAQGRGAGTTESPLSLGEPGHLVLETDDGLPFTAFLQRTDAEPSVDSRLVRGRPSGGTVSAWALDGSVTLAVEPGSYSLVAHRGIRYEAHQATVEVAAGEEVTVAIDLEAAYELEGWLIADPHTHGAPSNDGGIPMEHRLAVSAGGGIQVHFGTDHDHVADYRPLLEPMGLEDVLASVLADEASPLVGHINAYPLEAVPDASNGGAWLWWEEVLSTTQDIVDHLRERHEGVVLQMNHPTDSGVASAAGWSTGTIAKPERWSNDFDAMEVLNAAAHDDYTHLFHDLTSRGLRIAPVGVSDSHSYTGGQPGLNVTFLGAGTSEPAEFTSDALREAMTSRRTVVSMGPWLGLSIDPGSEVEGPQTLEVTVLSPSWIQVDELHLLENGVVVETVQGPFEGAVSFALSPSADAYYVVEAEGATDLSPVWPGKRPWAMTSPIFLDTDGDGWTAPLPAL